SPRPMRDADRRRHVVMRVRNAYTHDSRVEKEARTLVTAGHRVTVVADGAVGLPGTEDRPGGERVIRVERRGLRLAGLRFVVHELRLLRRLVALRPDVLHAHDSNALLPVALAARRCRVPFVYDAHDLWLGRPRRERGRLSFALHQAWYGLVERVLIPRAAATITVSPPIVEHLRDRYGLARVALVPNYPELEPAPVTLRTLGSLPGGDRIAPDRPIVLYLGGLMGGRGLETLVDAIARTDGPQLVLLGDGLLADPLRARAANLGIGDRVHLLPPVPPAEVIGVAASADLGVSPIPPSCLNYRYSLPNKLFQYLAAGLPVVASDFPQVRDVVEGSRCGVVADPTSAAAMAGAIESVLADPVEARAMGERGRRAVAERYHWGVAAERLLEVYSAL
ncbi:MAG: glycosyltransferase family 4 protein, partial [Chloroflexi bacterium]|nr:glycosyltransferase family 4 protein [Chloroflexota bacterium]